MQKNPILIEPSLLSGDFGKLGEEAIRMEKAGADAIHIDVMDGHFVPNLTFGPQVVSAVNRVTDLFLDIHLMIYNPFEYVERFVEAGADRITFHIEATEDVEETLRYIRKCNIQAGLAFCPDTTHELIPKYLDKCDLILIMTVNPGFGGQTFIPEAVNKIRFIREMTDQMKIRKGGVIHSSRSPSLPPFDIQVDGGIDNKTGKVCVEAGANILVSGTYLFSSPVMKNQIEILKGLRP